jgi:hypothetical protein
MLYFPQKKEGKMLVYFRFLSAQYAMMPTTATTATAAMMAVSVVIKGASVVGCGLYKVKF